MLYKKALYSAVIGIVVSLFVILVTAALKYFNIWISPEFKEYVIFVDSAVWPASFPMAMLSSGNDVTPAMMTIFILSNGLLYGGIWFIFSKVGGFKSSKVYLLLVPILAYWVFMAKIAFGA